EAGQAVLAPPIRARPRVVVGEVVPGGAARAVVLPDRAPLALAEIRAPVIPVAGLAQPVLEPPKALDAIPLGTRPSPGPVHRPRNQLGHHPKRVHRDPRSPGCQYGDSCRSGVELENAFARPRPTRCRKFTWVITRGTTSAHPLACEPRPSQSALVR